MRLGYDLSIARHPMGGTRRYAAELMRAMRASQPPGWDLVGLAGVPRLRRDGIVPAPLRRAVNLMGDLTWLSAGATLAVARHGIDAWYSPANVLPPWPGRPAIVTIHDLNVFLVPSDYDPRYVSWARTMVALAARRASAVITPSGFVRGMVIERFDAAPDRVHAIPSGVDHMERVAPRPENDLPRPYALFVGTTERHKNVALLLDAWRDGVPRDLHLVLCGPPGRAHDDLRRTAGQRSLRGRVHFTGPQPADRLLAAYRDADLFLFPSRAEGFGFPPLEAMRQGIPTAVADATSLPEVTAGGALTFDPLDAASLARLIVRMHEDDELRGRLARMGPEVAARYRWASTASGVWHEVERVTAIG